MKYFIYFEDQDGGMGVTEATSEEDFRRLYGWMSTSCKKADTALITWMSTPCKKADTALITWMKTAEIGELFDHRLGYLVRLKDTEGL